MHNLIIDDYGPLLSPCGSPVQHGSAFVERSGTLARGRTSQERTAEAPGAYANNTTDKQPSARKTQENNTNDGQAVVVFQTDEAIERYELAPDEVLTLGEDERIVARPLADVVRDDIRATQENFGERQRSRCFYSSAQCLGTTDDWSAAERARLEAHLALRAHLEGVYADLGAFSVREALQVYFEASVVDTLFTGSPAEEQRIRAWIRHVRSDRGAGISNPAGFLRSRIDSGAAAPPIPARRRSR